MDSSTPTSVLRIARLNFTWVLPRNHAAPAAVRRQMEDLVKKDFTSIGRSAMEPLCPGHDPSVWFIRRVDLSVMADCSGQRENPVHALMTPLARSVSRALARGEE